MSAKIPADEQEQDRLSTQHKAFSIGFGGLYPAPEIVRAVLAPQEGVTKRILDLGCGSGIWCTEMAREFPHCDVLGVDLAPVSVLPEHMPANCKFEINDINGGLQHLQGMYDVVQARCISLGVNNFRESLQWVVGCAKPGGIVISMEGDFDFYSGWPMTYAPFWSNSNPQGSYHSRVLYEIRRSAVLAGSSVMSMEKLLDEGLWNSAPALDPDTCKAADVYLPVGTWCKQGDPAQQEQLRSVGMLMRENMMELSRIVQPGFLQAGWSKEIVDQWATGMQDECQNGTIGLRMRLAWGRRRAGPNLPAPDLHEVAVDNKVKYPFYEVYNTPGEAAVATETRNRGKDIPAPPYAQGSTQ